MGKNSIIDISDLNVPPERHELEAAKILAEKEGRIKFICPSNIKGNHTPDFLMQGRAWELKTPTGKGKTMIKNLFHAAAKQSDSIIFDIRYTKLNEEECIKSIKKENNIRTKKRKIKIITKNGEIIDL